MQEIKVTENELVEWVESYYEEVEKIYGHSKHHSNTPYIHLSDDTSEEIKGEYCYILNEIVLYYKNIGSIEELIRTLIHEYQHYLQSPSWMTRYYKMGYDYNNHPYEIEANKEEENWIKIWQQVSKNC
mgnify:CR=1 FL=1